MMQFQQCNPKLTSTASPFLEQAANTRTQTNLPPKVSQPSQQVKKVKVVNGAAAKVADLISPRPGQMQVDLGNKNGGNGGSDVRQINKINKRPQQVEKEKGKAASESSGQDDDDDDDEDDSSGEDTSESDEASKKEEGVTKKKQGDGGGLDDSIKVKIKQIDRNRQSPLGTFNELATADDGFFTDHAQDNKFLLYK